MHGTRACTHTEPRDKQRDDTSDGGGGGGAVLVVVLVGGAEAEEVELHRRP